MLSFHTTLCCVRSDAWQGDASPAMPTLIPVLGAPLVLLTCTFWSRRSQCRTARTCAWACGSRTKHARSCLMCTHKGQHAKSKRRMPLLHAPTPVITCAEGWVLQTRWQVLNEFLQNFSTAKDQVVQGCICTAAILQCIFKLHGVCRAMSPMSIANTQLHAQ